MKSGDLIIAVQRCMIGFWRGFTATVILLVLLQSCAARGSGGDPEVQEGTAEITVEWGKDARPHSVRLLFYDQSGVLVEIADEVTGMFRATLPAGAYRLVVHNTDAKQVVYHDLDSYENARVHAMHTGVADMPGKACILMPQEVFATGCCKEFKVLNIAAGETLKATVAPLSLTNSLNLYFGMQNMDDIQMVKGMLNGVAPGVFLSTGANDTSSVCSVEFQAQPQTRGKVGYGANIGFFNLVIDKDSPAGTNTLDITVVDVNGTAHTSTVDVTDVLKDIIEGNGGNIPSDIPIDMKVELKLAEDLEAMVVPWDESGSGGGTPRPNK